MATQAAPDSPLLAAHRHPEMVYQPRTSNVFSDIEHPSKPIKFYFDVTIFTRLLIAVFALTGLIVHAAGFRFPQVTLELSVIDQSLCFVWNLFLLAKAFRLLTKKGKLACLPRFVLELGPWRYSCGGSDDEDDQDNMEVRPLLDGLRSKSSGWWRVFVSLVDLALAITLFVCLIMDLSWWRGWPYNSRAALWTLMTLVM